MQYSQNVVHPEVGGILHLEHVNFTITGSQDMITTFFVNGLGFTRDPFRRTDETNFGVNMGMQQFHFPSGNEPTEFHGKVHLVCPDLEMIRIRLERLEMMGRFKGTPYALTVKDKELDVVTPLGQRMHIVDPSTILFPHPIGMFQVDLPIPRGAAEGTAAYYRDVLGAPVALAEHEGKPAAMVTMGQYQTVHFYEDKVPGFDYDYDTFHLAFYITNYNAIADRLESQGKIKGHRGPIMFFSKEVFDPRTGGTLFPLENEVRSVFHFDFMRPLVNRWPLVTEPFTDQFMARRDFNTEVGFNPGKVAKPPKA